MESNKYIDFYVKDEMKELKRIVIPLIEMCGLPQSEYDEILSSMVGCVWESSLSYREDKNTKFTTYLQNNIRNRIKSYLRDTSRAKDIDRRDLVSLSVEPAEGLSYEDIIESNFDIFREMGMEQISNKAETYLSKLSKLQYQIVMLLMDGYKRNEIIDILHITPKAYADAMSEIRSTKKIKYLY